MSAEVVDVTGLSNAEFLERYAAPGRVGLAGGNALINRAIRRAQRRLRADDVPSDWSHVFLFTERRVDGRLWALESDLDLAKKQIRLGVQENRIDKYHDPAEYPNLGVLDFGLSAEQARAVQTEGLNLLARLTRYSLRELVGTFLALQSTRLRARENVLSREGSLYCSAMVQHCYTAAGVRLRPAVDTKNITPEDVASSPAARTLFRLRREET